MRVYPKYKDTSIPWLGKIPSQWEKVRLKFLCKVQTGDRDTAHALPDGAYPFFVRSLKVPRINSFSFDCEAILTPGDGDVGNIFHHVNGKFDFHQRVYMMNQFRNVYPRFFYYYMRGMFICVAKDGSAKTTVDSLRLPMLHNFWFVLPTLEEQKIISIFLDRETSRIDNLIAEKQTFINLLKEKRQALISHVVTKGLDPSVKMKDSGIEWIGEVPKHWELTKLRYLGQCQNGINIGGEYFGNGYPFVSYGDVYKNRTLPREVKGLVQSSENDQKHFSVKEGDVLFTRTSETIEEIGFSSVCKSTIDNAVFAGFLIRFRPALKKISSDYAEYYFQNKKLRAFFVKEMNLVTRASLSQELLKQMPVLIPPKEEQRKITEYLKLKVGRIESLISETERSILLLKEHRTALISLAVTGKIDIRNYEETAA